MFNLMDFSEILKELMLENSLTNILLEEKSGCPRGCISKWLNGKNTPKPDSLIKLSNFFNCSIEYLLSRNDNKDNYDVSFVSTFEERLKELCVSRQLSFYALCKQMEMKNDLIYLWTKGKCKPTLYHIEKLSNFFNVSIDFMLGRKY